VSRSDNLRKHELECQRLASNCMQLADCVESPTLQRHFLRMAAVWAAHADQDLSVNHTKNLNSLPSPQHKSRHRVPAQRS